MHMAAITERKEAFDAAVRGVVKAVAVRHLRDRGFTLSDSSSGPATVALRGRRVAGAPHTTPCFAALFPGGGVGEEVLVTSVNSFLNIYNTILIARLLCTWFPQVPQQIVGPLATMSDPYLNAFRGLIPPLGGLDLSPILAFTVLNVLQGGAAALPAEMAKGKAVRQQPFHALKKGRKSE